MLGDVIISIDTASRQAEERQHSVEAELRILLVHGLLHLLGYDHETNNEDLMEVCCFLPRRFNSCQARLFG